MVAQWSWCLDADAKNASSTLATVATFSGGEMLEARVVCDVSTH